MAEYIPESEGAWVLVEENSSSCAINTPETPSQQTNMLQLLGVAALGLVGGFVIFGGNK